MVDGEISGAEALEKLTKHEAGEWDKEILNLNSLHVSYRHTTEGSFYLMLITKPKSQIKLLNELLFLRPSVTPTKVEIPKRFN